MNRKLAAAVRAQTGIEVLNTPTPFGFYLGTDAEKNEYLVTCYWDGDTQKFHVKAFKKTTSFDLPITALG